MNDNELKQILKIILDCLKQNPVWRLEGGANLRVQGMDVNVSDLDIATDEQGINIFRESLKQYITKDFFNEKTNSITLTGSINNVELDINAYQDKELRMFEEIHFIDWNDLKLPILPLKYAKRFYELINRKEKAELIEKYISA